MVLWYMSDRVKSGTSEKLIAVRDERLEVETEGSGRLLLKCETWSKRNQVGKVIGSRARFAHCTFHCLLPSARFTAQRVCPWANSCCSVTGAQSKS